MSDYPYLLDKTVGEHYMTIHANYEMGGGAEEVVWWCHTCDPTGKDTFSVDYRDVPDPQKAVQLLMDFEKIHTAEVPDE